VDDSVQDQRRFISDASHELKSPVAATRIMLETARDYPDIIDTQTLIEDLSAENDRMAQIVSDLLFLARHDEGVRKLELKRTDLSDLIAKEAADLTNRFGIPCDISGVQTIACNLDKEAIGRMLRNLLDNAARYADKGIWIECSQTDNAVRILISDDGIGIPEEDRERVFERFARLDEDRARSSGGTGLGLPVVRAIATQHLGTAQFIPPIHGGSTVEITLSKNLR
ncbi:MAG: HAMP domain-containing histidine kinase, partial [Actinobacteria bacterium]|nr:HAMP domain-containing histidine kinase [Actinomycetota bacterium]